MSKQYLYKVSVLNRKNSHPLESISYYSGEEQFDMLNGKKYNSNSVDNVIWNNILIPNKELESDLFKNLPDYLKFRNNKKDIISNARNILWQSVYSREVREDAQFSRLFEVLIPGFCSTENAIAMLEEFGRTLVNEGMIVDCSIHYRGKLNKGINKSLLEIISQKKEEKTDDIESNSDYVGFLVCTLRDYKNGMFMNKNRDWNSRKKMEEWRKKWVEILTVNLEKTSLTEIEKKSWEEKLSIYGEYALIKEQLNKTKTIGLTNKIN